MALPVVEEECPEFQNVKNHTNLFCVQISRLGKFFCHNLELFSGSSLGNTGQYRFSHIFGKLLLAF